MPANGNIIRLEGKRFGMLLVLRREGRVLGRAAWRCKCDCGKQVIVDGTKLRQGAKKSCGQGHYYKRPINIVAKAENRAWHAMLQRCYNKNGTGFSNYGGRGIRVHSKWRKDFQQFLADVGPRPSTKHSIDRYPDNNGDYEPGNVRWATKSQQARNTRVTVRVVVDGAQIPLKDYTEKLGLEQRLVRKRFRRGMSLEDAITKPRYHNRDPWPQEWLDYFKEK